MKKTVSIHDFRAAFSQLRPDNFTYDGLAVLFDYFEDCEQDGEEFELDVIAICCDFIEDHYSIIANDYSIELEDDLEDEEKMQIVKRYLEDEGVLIGETDNTFVYRQF
jgi:hypothetical protein